MTTEADMRSIRSTLDQYDNEQKEKLENAPPNGGRFATAADARAAIGADQFWSVLGDTWSLKISGASHKIVVGVVETEVHGFAASFTLAKQYSAALSAEMKVMLAGSVSKCDATVTSTTGGAQVGFFGGVKIEREKAVANDVGLTPRVRAEVKSMEKVLGAFNLKIGKWTNKVATKLFKTPSLKGSIGKMEKACADLEEKIKQAKEHGPQWEADYASFNADGSGGYEIDASNVGLNGKGGLQLFKGGDGANLFPSDQVLITGGGSHVQIGPSDLYMNGPTIKLGISF